MKEYIKPFIEEEEVEIVDVIAESLTNGGVSEQIDDEPGGEEF